MSWAGSSSAKRQSARSKGPPDAPSRPLYLQDAAPNSQDDTVNSSETEIPSDRLSSCSDRLSHHDAGCPLSLARKCRRSDDGISANRIRNVAAILRRHTSSMAVANAAGDPCRRNSPGETLTDRRNSRTKTVTSGIPQSAAICLTRRSEVRSRIRARPRRIDFRTRFGGAPVFWVNACLK